MEFKISCTICTDAFEQSQIRILNACGRLTAFNCSLIVVVLIGRNFISGHGFCKQCIKKLVREYKRRGNPGCPTCRSKFEPTNIITPYLRFPGDADSPEPLEPRASTARDFSDSDSDISTPESDYEYSRVSSQSASVFYLH